MTDEVLGCTVYIDGQRFADGREGDNLLDPVALDGLRVVWGRETTVDQPDTSTCTFEVMDVAGSRGFLDLLYTGAAVDVRTSVDVGGGTGPARETIQDGGFETTAPGQTPPNVRLTGSGSARVVGDEAVTYAWDGTPRASSSTQRDPGGAVLRRNNAVNPRALSTGGRWAYQNGTGETGATAWVTGATDGPVLPDGTRATTYVRRTITTPKTAGSSGVFYRATPGDIAGTAGQSMALAFYLRVSSTLPGDACVASVHARLGSTTVTATAGAAVALAGGEWVRVGGAVTATGPFDGYQVWAALQPGSILPAGSTIDAVAVLVEPDVLTAGPYFDGDSLPSGGHALEVVNTSKVAALVAPAPWVMGDPDAWDDIPSGVGGDVWTYALDLAAVEGVDYTLDVVALAGPSPSASLAVLASFPGVATGAVEHLTGSLTLPTPPPYMRYWLGLRVRVGNGPTWDSWTPEAEQWDEVDAALRWDDLRTVRLDNASLLAPPEGVLAESVVFAGNITDLSAAWDESFPPAGGTRVKVTCVDFTASLANRFVGDEPWPVETMETRFRRVLDMVPLPGLGASIIDPDLGAIKLGYQDVDSQASMSLLSSFATSVDGVLWPAYHVTMSRLRYFYVEDVDKRTTGLALTFDAASGYVVIDTSGAHGGERIALSACDVLREPIVFVQAPGDVATRVAIGWQEQTTDETGKPAPTDRTYELINAPAETRLGTVRVQSTTLLQAEADAESNARRLLGRASTTANPWRASGVVWDLALNQYTDDVQARAADLLDGTTRIGAPLLLTDLPEWAPTSGTLPVFLEGGEYEFTGGRWVLSLTVSNVYGLGASAQWDELDPAWAWDQMSPDITWADLRGVAASTSNLLDDPDPTIARRSASRHNR